MSPFALREIREDILDSARISQRGTAATEGESSQPSAVSQKPSLSSRPLHPEGSGLPRCNTRRNPRIRCLFRHAGSVIRIARAEGPGSRPACPRKAQRAGHSTAVQLLPLCRMAGLSALKFPMWSLSRAFSPGWRNGWPFRPEEMKSLGFTPWMPCPEGYRR